MSGWFVDKFKNDLERLNQLRSNVTSQEELEKIDDTILTLESLMSEAAYRMIIGNVSTSYLLQREEVLLSDFQDFTPLIKTITDMDYVPTYDGYIPIPKLTNEDVLELTYDFFKECTDREIFKLFRSMFKKRKNLVHMERLGVQYIEPYSIFLPFYKKVHIFLKRTKGIDDLTDLSHEYGHGIQYLVNYHSNYYGENNIFSEIVSMFFELLDVDYLSKIGEFKECAQNYQKEFFNSMRSNSQITLLDEKILARWRFFINTGVKKSTKETEKELIKALKDTDFELYSLRLFLSLDITEQIPYSISYLIALEIFMVYKKDRDKGMYLIKRIMAIDLRLDKEDYYQEILRLGIIPNENLENFKNHIMKPKAM